MRFVDLPRLISGLRRRSESDTIVILRSVEVSSSSQSHSLRLSCFDFTNICSSLVHIKFTLVRVHVYITIRTTMKAGLAPTTTHGPDVTRNIFKYLRRWDVHKRVYPHSPIQDCRHRSDGYSPAGVTPRDGQKTTPRSTRDANVDLEVIETIDQLGPISTVISGSRPLSAPKRAVVFILYDTAR